MNLFNILPFLSVLDDAGGSPEPTPDGGSVLDDQSGSQGAEPNDPAWMSQLPKEMRKPEYRQYKTFGEALQAAESAKPVIPGAEASDDAWNTYFASIGRPGNPEEYSLPEELKDEKFKDTVTRWKQDAHAMGMNDAQFKRFLDHQAKTIESARVESDKAAQNAKTELHRVWGADMDANLALAKAGLTAIIPDDEARKMILQSPLANNTAFISGLVKVAKMLKTDTTPKGEKPKPKPGWTFTDM